jgi:DNA-directed RNA polymerase subunit beta
VLYDKGSQKFEETYELQTFIRTNQYSCFHQRPIVQKGEEFKKGDVINHRGKSYLVLGLGKKAFLRDIKSKGKLLLSYGFE